MHLLNFQIKVWFLTGLLFWDWLKGQKLICTSAQCMTVCRKARGNFNVLGFHLDSLWHLLCNFDINQVKWLPLKLAYACCYFCSYSLHYYYYSTFENSSNSPPSEKKRKSCLSNVLRDHPYITSAKGLQGWWDKIMAVFADVNYCIYADIVGGWVRTGPKMCWRNIWIL